jgi:homogentisate 1,2-dioxygenase
MSGHGPDGATADRAAAADTSRPEKLADTMAFMFETRMVLRPTRQAMDALQLQRDYAECWQGLRRNFQPPR